MDNIHSVSNNMPDGQPPSIGQYFSSFQYEEHFGNPEHQGKHVLGLPSRDHLPAHLQQQFSDGSSNAKPVARDADGSSRAKLKHTIYAQTAHSSHNLINQSHLHQLPSATSYSAASIGSEYIPNAHTSPLKYHPDMELVAAHLRMTSDVKFTPPNSAAVVNLDHLNMFNPVYDPNRSDQYVNELKSNINKFQSQNLDSHPSSSASLGNNFASVLGHSNYAEQNIEWKSIGLNSTEYIPMVHNFVSQSGPVHSEAKHSALQIFRRLMDEELVTLIINEMNDRGRKILNEEVTYTNKKNKKPKLETQNSDGSYQTKRPTEWVPIDSREFWSFIAIMLYMSVVKIPCIRRYWNKEIWGQPVVQELMNRDRFCVLLRCLEFADVTESTPTDFMNLNKVVPMIHKMCENFRAEYIPDEQICLERSILQANGKFKYKNKPSDDSPEGVAPVGIKSYLLCEAKSGYVLDFFVHTGKSADYTSPLGEKMFNATYTDLAACKLLSNFIGKGHTLFTDVYYTNPLLFTFLNKEAGINCVGLANSNTVHYPDPIKPDNAQVGKGETVNMIGGVFNSKILAQTWRIKEDDPPRHILMLSTKHPPCTKVVAQKHKGYLHKPLSHLEFRDHIGALDRLDQTCGIPLPGEEGPQSKFPYKLFIRFFNIIIHNAFVIWRQFDPKANLGYGTQFRLAVMKELKEEFDMFKRQMIALRRQQMSVDEESQLHTLTKTPVDKNGKRSRRKCVHCVNAFGKKTTTNHECKECDEGFCRPCFKHVHNKLNMIE